MQRTSKVTGLGNFPELGKALYIWFCQKRAECVEISGQLLCEKANSLAKTINGEATTLDAKTGWKWRFCQRHGIHTLKEHGEKASADCPATKKFISFFPELRQTWSAIMQAVVQLQWNWSEIPLVALYNASHSCWKDCFWAERIQRTCHVKRLLKCFRNLQTVTADATKVFLQHSTGSHTHGLHWAKNAWMTTAIFHTWFYDTFVPKVCQHLTSIGMELKARLLLDNCPAHPNADWWRLNFCQVSTGQLYEPDPAHRSRCDQEC